MEVDDWIRQLRGQHQPRGQARSKASRKSSPGSVEQHIAAMGVIPGKKLTKDELLENIAEMAIKENDINEPGVKELDHRLYMLCAKYGFCSIHRLLLLLLVLIILRKVAIDTLRKNPWIAQ